MLHMEPSEIIRDKVKLTLMEKGIGVRKLEEQTKLPKWFLRGVIDESRKQTPSVDRAKEICDALGLEFYIGPPRGNNVACTKEHLDRDTMNKAISCVTEGVEKSGKSYNNQEIANLALAAYDFLHDDPNTQASQPSDKSAKIIQLITKIKAA